MVISSDTHPEDAFLYHSGWNKKQDIGINCSYIDLLCQLGMKNDYFKGFMLEALIADILYRSLYNENEFHTSPLLLKTLKEVTKLYKR